MKNCFMSLVVCLGFGFWSSYGGADYLEDQVLKYCKEYMKRILKGDSQNFSYKIDLSKKYRYGLSPFDYRAIYYASCVASHTEKTKEYTVKIQVYSDKAQSEGVKTFAYEQAISMHSKGHTIPIGAVEFNVEPMFGNSFKRIGYIAIIKLCSGPGPGYFTCRWLPYSDRG